MGRGPSLAAGGRRTPRARCAPQSDRRLRRARSGAPARPSGTGSLAEPAQQIGKALRARRSQPIGELVVLGTEEVVIKRRDGDLLHAPALSFGAARRAAAWSSVRRRVMAMWPLVSA